MNEGATPADCGLKGKEAPEVESARGRASDSPCNNARWAAFERTGVGILFLYFMVHTISRTLVSPCVELDEAEQMVFGQRLAFSYGNALPLYTWIQILFFKVFGETVLGLAAFKNCLLFGITALSYWLGKAWTGNPRAGLIASVCVLLTPQIVWESQRDLTHSVLACFLVLAWLACAERARETRRTGWYLALGLVTAAGALSKFNFSVCVICTICAGLLMREFRGAILNWRAGAALALCAGILFAWWMGYSRQASGLEGAISKLHIQAESSRLMHLGLGTWRVLKGATASCVIPAVALLWLARRNLRAPQARIPEWARLMPIAWLWMAVAAIATIGLLRMQGFHQRWLQPLLMAFPVYAAVMANPRLTDRSVVHLRNAGAAVMLIVALVMPGRTVFGWGKDEPYLRPYPELAKQLASSLPPGAAIVTDTTLLGGNLRIALRATTVFTPEIAHLFPASQHCAAVWDTYKSEAPPAVLQAWANTKSATTRWEPQFITAPYARTPDKRRRLAVVVLW